MWGALAKAREQATAMANTLLVAPEDEEELQTRHSGQSADTAGTSDVPTHPGNGQASDGAGPVKENGTGSQPGSSAPAAASKLVGARPRPAAAATAVAGSVFSTLSTASSVLQKVATHVVGADEAVPVNKAQRSQLDLLKEQLISISQENDALVKENEMLTAKFSKLQNRVADHEAEGQMLEALQEKTRMLQSELSSATQTRQDLEQELARCKSDLDAAQNAVAERDTIWIAEVAKERAARQAAEQQLQQAKDQPQQPAQPAVHQPGSAAGTAGPANTSVPHVEIEALQKQLAEVQASLAAAEKAREDLQARTDAAAQQHADGLRAVRAELAAAHTELQRAQADTTADSLRSELSAAQGELAAVRAALTPVGGASDADSSTLLELLQRKLQDSDHTWQTRIQDLEHKLQAVESEARELRTKCDEVAAAAAAAARDADARAQRLEADLAAAQSRIEAGEAELASVQRSKGGVGHGVGGGDSLDRVLARVRDSDSGSDERGVGGGSMGDDSVDVSQRVKEMHRVLQDVCASLGVEREAALAQDSAVQDMEHLLYALRTQAPTLKAAPPQASSTKPTAELDSLRSQLAAAQSQLSAAEEQLAAAEGELVGLRCSDVGSLREQLDMMKELYEDERIFAQQARKELKEVQAQLQAVEDRFQAHLNQQQTTNPDPTSTTGTPTTATTDQQLTLSSPHTADLQQQLDHALQQAADAHARLDAASADAEARVAAAEASVSALQAQVATLQGALDSLTREAEGLRQGLSGSHERCVELQGRVEGLEGEVQAARAAADEAELRLQAQETEIALLTERLATSEARSRSASDAGTQAAAELSSLREQLTAAQTNAAHQLAALRQQHDTEVASLRQELAAAQQRADAAAAEGARVGKEAASAAAELASASAQVARLQQQLQATGGQQDEVMKERDAFWKAELMAKGTRLADLEARASTAEDAATRAAAAESAARAQCASLQSQLSALQDTHQAQELLVARLQRELEDTLKAVEASQHAAQDAAQREDDAEGAVRAARADAARHQAEAQRVSAELQEVTQQLTTARAEVAALQQQVAGLQAAQAQQQQSQEETSRSAQGTSAELEQLQQQVASLQAELSAAQAAVATGESERERLRTQLARLKEQMLQEQDDDDATLTLRVEEEVRMLRGEWEAERQQERAVWDAERAAAAQHAAQERAALEQQRVRLERELAALKADLQREQQAAARVKQESSGWDEMLALKDTEIANLQAALGELTYESEAAEQLRHEVRAATTRAGQLSAQLSDVQRQLESSQAAQTAAETKAGQAMAAMNELRAVAQRTQQECGMLRHALDAAMAQVQALTSESNTHVDKAIMGKLLTTYFERGCSRDVLLLMTRMLSMSDEDQQHILAVATRRGILSRVAGAPLALGRALVGGGGGSAGAARGGARGPTLADQWVEFLLSQAEREAAAAGAGAVPGAPAGTDASSTTQTRPGMSARMSSPGLPPSTAFNPHLSFPNPAHAAMSQHMSQPPSARPLLTPQPPLSVDPGQLHLPSTSVLHSGGQGNDATPAHWSASQHNVSIGGAIPAAAPSRPAEGAAAGLPWQGRGSEGTWGSDGGAGLGAAHTQGGTHTAGLLQPYPHTRAGLGSTQPAKDTLPGFSVPTAPTGVQSSALGGVGAIGGASWGATVPQPGAGLTSAPPSLAGMQYGSLAPTSGMSSALPVTRPSWLPSPPASESGQQAAPSYPRADMYGRQQ